MSNAAQELKHAQDKIIKLEKALTDLANKFNQCSSARDSMAFTIAVLVHRMGGKAVIDQDDKFLVDAWKDGSFLLNITHDPTTFGTILQAVRYERQDNAQFQVDKDNFDPSRNGAGYGTGDSSQADAGTPGNAG